MPRKKAFSNKQKKAQLQRKRQCKRKDEASFEVECSGSENSLESDEDVTHSKEISVVKLHHHVPAKGISKQHDPNRFRLHFGESKEEIEYRQDKAKNNAIIPMNDLALEVDVDEVYSPGSVLDMPKRPPWSYDMTKTEQEEVMFEAYLEQIHSQFPSHKLSYFEHNLETWRQLWRVLEISNIVLLITDVRHPVLHFPPALYSHVVNELNKPILLILNKIDLVPIQVAIAWKHYFHSKFPQLNVICFTCYKNNELTTEYDRKVQMKVKRQNAHLSTIGREELLTAIGDILKCKIDVAQDVDKELAMTACSEGTAKKGLLTIGLVGHPNVGKSSILNNLVGKKSVSTSRTPGHTKHLQTIFITPTVQLCDCPGLVFPSLIDKQLQILSGIYPISQVKEPYTSVGYLAERVSLIDLLQLTHSNVDSDKPECSSSITWTAWDICDAWAEKKGYFTSRRARPDTFRAANHLLRLASNGRICLFFRPPGFSLQKDHWEQNTEVLAMISQQKELLKLQSIVTDESFSESEEDDELLQISTSMSKDKNRFDSLADLDESD